MFSEELEMLIEAALADGEITEKERSVLHKRALAEGVDPDELDVIVDARLIKMGKVEKDWLRPTPPQGVENSKSSNSMGEIKRCPHCNAVVPVASTKCEECEYVFRNVEVVSSRQKLSEIIEEINKKDFSSGGIVGFLGLDLLKEERKDQARAQAIINFPVPNAKEDLLEFLLFLEPHNKKRSLNSEERESVKAYRTKYEECIRKASLFFADDPQFQMFFPKKKKGWFRK